MEGRGLSGNLHDMWQYRLNSRPEPGNEARYSSLDSRLASFPGHSHLVFDRLQYAKKGGGRPGRKSHVRDVR